MLIKDDKILFVHIPRCAGVSVEQFFGWDGLRHETLQTYVNENTEEFLDSCFKFALVRNPWAKMVSWYFKHSNDIYEPKTVEGFREWLKGGLKHHWKNVDKTNWEEIAWDGSNDALSSLDFINNDKDIYIDFLGRVENIEEDWRIICESSNKEYKPLAHINKSEHEDYRDYYDEESAEIIYERFERDIGFFDYRF